MSASLGLRTATARLLLAYTALFAALAIAAALWIDRQWTQQSLHEVRAALQEQSAGLADVLRDEGVAGLQREIALRVRPAADPEALYALWSPDGVLLAGNGAPQIRLPASGMQEFRFAVTVGAADDKAPHEAIALVERLPNGYVLLVGRDIEAVQALQARVRWEAALTLAVFALLGIAGAWFGGRHLLRRIDTVSAAADRIGGGALSQRVPERGRNDEFDRLAGTINRMLDRIEALHAGMQTVLDAVAHDLRTPLAHARQALDTIARALPGLPPPDIAQAEAALDRIGRTLDGLLRIVQIDAGVAAVARESCDVAALAHDVVELYEPAAEARGMRMTLRAQPVVVPAHRQLLAQAFANLLDNAVKYAPAGSTVRIDVDSAEGRARFAVTDAGPGIAPAQRERAAARFVRLHDAGDVPGSGLGLALVAAIARLHGGTISFDDARPGLRAIITLPLDGDAPDTRLSR